MMKKIFCIIFALITFLIVDCEVEARVRWWDVELECVYANGIVIGSKLQVNGKESDTLHSIYVKEYPVAKTAVIEGTQISNIGFQKNRLTYDHDFNRLKEMTCPSNVRYWIAWSKTENGDVEYNGVYAFDWCTDDVYCSSGDYTITESLRKNKTSGWWIFSETETLAGTLNVTGTGLTEQAQPEAVIPLVGERIYIVDDIDDDGYWATFKLYSGDGTQAVGTPQYAQMYSAYLYNHNTGKWGYRYLLQVGKTLTSTRISSTGFTTYPRDVPTWICVKQSNKTQDASRGDGAYTFDRARNEIKSRGYSEPTNPANTCPAGSQLYIRTSDVCRADIEERPESFCEKYPSTAFVLIDIIKIMQVLVPAIVIIFTGIEIGRIVVAGNLEEELPKRKKSLIIRFVVMIAFLFIQPITQVIISLAEGVSILDVSCLFNDGEAIVRDDCALCESVYSNCVKGCTAENEETCTASCLSTYNTCSDSNCNLNCTVSGEEDSE